MSIYRDVSVLIDYENNIASTDSKITVYRGDKNIVLRFDVKEYKYRFTNTNSLIKEVDATSAEFTIKKPNEIVFKTAKTTIVNNKAQLVITADMTDELTELGVYHFQMHLWCEHTDTTAGRITLPPLQFFVEDLMADVGGNPDVPVTPVYSYSWDDVTNEPVRLAVKNGATDTQYYRNGTWVSV